MIYEEIENENVNIIKIQCNDGVIAVPSVLIKMISPMSDIICTDWKCCIDMREVIDVSKDRMKQAFPIIIAVLAGRNFSICIAEVAVVTTVFLNYLSSSIEIPKDKCSIDDMILAIAKYDAYVLYEWWIIKHIFDLWYRHKSMIEHVIESLDIVKLWPELFCNKPHEHILSKNSECKISKDYEIYILKLGSSLIKSSKIFAKYILDRNLKPYMDIECHKKDMVVYVWEVIGEEPYMKRIELYDMKFEISVTSHYVLIAV